MLKGEIMKKQIILITLFLLCIGLVSALTIDETVSATTVNQGEKITITYTPKDYQHKIAWVLQREVPDGWLLITQPGLLVEGNVYGMLGSGADPIVIEVKAPMVGGEYTFVGGEWAIIDILEDDSEIKADGEYSDFTVTVVGDNQCDANAWSCNAWPSCMEGDKEVSRNCANECGETKTETKKCGGFDCNEFFSFLGIDPELNCIIGIVGGIFILFVFMNMIPRRR